MAPLRPPTTPTAAVNNTWTLHKWLENCSQLVAYKNRLKCTPSSTVSGVKISHFQTIRNLINIIVLWLSHIYEVCKSIGPIPTFLCLCHCHQKSHACICVLPGGLQLISLTTCWTSFKGPRIMLFMLSFTRKKLHQLQCLPVAACIDFTTSSNSSTHSLSMHFVSHGIIVFLHCIGKQDIHSTNSLCYYYYYSCIELSI